MYRVLQNAVPSRNAQSGPSSVPRVMAFLAGAVCNCKVDASATNTQLDDMANGFWDDARNGGDVYRVLTKMAESGHTCFDTFGADVEKTSVARKLQDYGSLMRSFVTSYAEWRNAVVAAEEAKSVSESAAALKEYEAKGFLENHVLWVVILNTDCGNHFRTAFVDSAGVGTREQRAAALFEHIIAKYPFRRLPADWPPYLGSLVDFAGEQIAKVFCNRPEDMEETLDVLERFETASQSDAEKLAVQLKVIQSKRPGA